MLLPSNQLSGYLVPDRCFMKKMGLKPIYDVYNKKAAQDRVSPSEYELIYNGTGERHNTKRQYVGVYINPILPWKNITCTFETAIKLPDSINVFIPWHKEYYRLAGHKSIILRERFKRPIDYDRMLGLVKALDE
ncbi:hypothetical protein ACI65C_011808 [Semiaphis heraclei]